MHRSLSSTDAEYLPRLHCLFGVGVMKSSPTALYWLTRTIFQVDVTVTETTTVAEEVVVYRTVVTVFDTTQFAVTFTGADVTADGT